MHEHERKPAEKPTDAHAEPAAKSDGKEDKKEDEKAGNPIVLSMTPTLTTLFHPTAKYLGTEIGSWVKLGVEGVKQKVRERNVQAHVDAVAANGPPPPQSVEPEQLLLFDQWTKGAADVDPADIALSKMWEELLKKIRDKSFRKAEIIDVLRQISPDEALVLNSLGHRGRSLPSRDDPSEPLLKALMQKGLVERDFRKLLLSASIVIAAALLYILVSALAEQGGSERIRSQMTALLEAFVVGVASCGILMPRFFLGWRLSWRGAELMSYVKATSPVTHKPDKR